MSPDPVPTPPRPGDVILVRAIAWWDSGQIQRAITGIVLAAAPILLDLYERQALTWRSAVSAVLAGLFAWMGLKRAKSPDVVTGVKAFDRANVVAANVPPAGPKPGP